MTLGEAALRYADLGLSVIPLHGKIPLFKNWPEVSTAEPTQINRWWNQDPTANIGIVTGAKSHVFVVDIDPRHGGQESLEELWAKHGRFPSTWTDITGSGGTHYYFRYPAFLVQNKTNIHPGIDIKGDQGQVVAPPSVHPDTQRLYQWDGLREPWDDRDGLAVAPVWLLDLLQEKKQNLEKERICLGAQIPHGVQHTTLVSLAGQLRRMGLSAREIFPSLMEVNLARCERPGAEANIRKIAESMERYQPSSRALATEANKLWNQTRYYEEIKVNQKKKVGLVDAYELLKNPPEPRVEVIEGILHHGSTIVAGRPKAGKSWLALQMAISVAVGAPFMGWCRVKKPGGVLYGALEETSEVTGQRISMLTQEHHVQLQNLQFFYELPDGGLEALGKMIAETNANLVIIDTYLALYKNFRAQRKNTDLLADDYAKLDWVTQLAKRLKTAIVLIHHTKKDSAGQGLDAVIGSSGTTANAECIWTIDRKPERKAELQVKGRHAPETQFLISLDIQHGIGWSVEEAGDDVEYTDVETEIVAVLREIGSASVKQLSSETKKTSAAMRMALRRMHVKGRIEKIGDAYSLVPTKVIPMT